MRNKWQSKCWMFCVRSASVQYILQGTTSRWHNCFVENVVDILRMLKYQDILLYLEFSPSNVSDLILGFIVLQTISLCKGVGRAQTRWREIFQWPGWTSYVKVINHSYDILFQLWDPFVSTGIRYFSYRFLSTRESIHTSPREVEVGKNSLSLTTRFYSSSCGSTLLPWLLYGC